MANALWISLIGMSLVFLALFLLWGLMALLVLLTEEKAPYVGDDLQPHGDSNHLIGRKQQAAAAAVAAALAISKQLDSVVSKPLKAASLSPWQATHRAGHLNRFTIRLKKRAIL